MGPDLVCSLPVHMCDLFYQGVSMRQRVVWLS